MTLKVAITGGIGSGKSTSQNMLINYVSHCAILMSL